ncbi:MAG: hypothetical protein LBT86_05585 [Deltaproteobacteria bacterium]|nr:hypothetical protein [Deltaproteobacteria bacterium]
MGDQKTSFWNAESEFLTGYPLLAKRPNPPLGSGWVIPASLSLPAWASRAFLAVANRLNRYPAQLADLKERPWIGQVKALVANLADPVLQRDGAEVANSNAALL